jgi:putative transposase
LEDLNIKGMIKNNKLSKHISDASWSKFIELLTYKAEWNDKKIVKIDRFFPSSKTCNSCGYINQNLKLDMREWTCPSCNTKLDRDLKQILKFSKLTSFQKAIVLSRLEKNKSILLPFSLYNSNI